MAANAKLQNHARKKSKRTKDSKMEPDIIFCLTQKIPGSAAVNNGAIAAI